MLIGRINFNSGKKGRQCRVDFENLRICLMDYYYERKGYVLCCKNCGHLLCPKIELVGPRNAGWKKKKGFWYCHQCSSHGGGWMTGSEEDCEKYRNDLIEINKQTEGRIMIYKINHPWTKFKRIQK